MPMFLALPNRTSLSGSWTGSDLSITASSKLKMAVLAPMPSASESTAIRVNPGLFNSMRNP